MGETRRFDVRATIADLEAADEVSLVEEPAGHLALCREAASWLREFADREQRAVAAGEAELVYYRTINCACTAAQRYVHDCPKHGHPEPCHD